MPQYKKAFDIGTYTGNGGMYRVGMPTLRGVGPSGKQAAGSLRFRSISSTYMSRTNGTPTSLTNMTFSFWLKRVATGTRNIIFTNDSGSGGAYGYFEIYSDNSLTCGDNGAGGYSSTYKFMDTSKWINVTVRFDTTSATAVDRMIVYIDGKRDNGSYTGIAQNASLYLNTTGYSRQIGSFTRIGTYSDFYLSEFYFVDGQSLDHTSFTEFNSDGILVPKAFSGTYGNNGFYLPMNSSSNYVTDQSGKGNNFTPSGFNITTSNTYYDLVTDSPTDYSSGTNNIGSYAVLNASDNPGSMTLGFGNLAFYKTSTYASVPASIKVTSGKWYFECGYVSDTAGGYGIGAAPASSFPYTDYMGHTVGCSIWKGTGGTTLYLNGGTNTSRSITAGDTMVCALDCDNGKVWVGYYSVSAATTYWLDSSGGVTGNPATGTNPSGTFTAGTLMAPGATFYSSGTYQFINFGQRAFTLTPPTGFVALNTYNITRPAESSLWFYGDSPDLVWIKNRSTTGWHLLTDTVRGEGYLLSSVSSNADSGGPGITEINKFGMSIINESGTFIGNGSGNSHVYWAWKAGSNTSSKSVTNTTGSITSQVSANPLAGFSIVTYSGQGTTGTVGHGIGSTPNFVIIKDRNTSGNEWCVYHSSLSSAAYYLRLDSTIAQTSAGYMNSTPPTSSVFTVGGATAASQSGHTYVAYCWAAIPGYSAFGSYTGNGSADGPFVYLGFRVRWIMWKRIDTTSSWFMYDAVRQTYNVQGLEMYADTTSAEGATTRMDFLSNGFKLRAANAGDNASGGTYVYAAFAEIPFKYARAR